MTAGKTAGCWKDSPLGEPGRLRLPLTNIRPSPRHLTHAGMGNILSPAPDRWELSGARGVGRTHRKDGVICNYGITIPILPQKEGGEMGDKNNKTERFSAYVVIPSQVFFDMELSDKAKLLYGLISSMCNHLGYCWAKNATLARFMGVKEDKSIRNYLSELKKRDYISVEQANENGTTIRKIYITALVNLSDRPVNFDLPPGKIEPYRPVNFDRQNNININNIPPIAPLEGCNDCASASANAAVESSRKTRPRQQAGKPVELSPEAEQQFAAFWEAYPVHKDKQKARLRWAQLDPSDELAAEILAAIAKLKQSDDWLREIIPLPSTFLHNRRWEDAEDLPAPPEQGGGIDRW